MRPAGCNTFDVNRCPLWYFRAPSLDPRSFLGSRSLPICLCSFCYSASGFQSGSHLETGRNARKFSDCQVPTTTAMYVSSRSPIKDIFRSFWHPFGTNLWSFGHLWPSFWHPWGAFGRLWVDLGHHFWNWHVTRHDVGHHSEAKSRTETRQAVPNTILTP